MYVIGRKNDVDAVMYVVRVDWSENRVTYAMNSELAHGYKNPEDAEVVCMDLNLVFPSREGSAYAFTVERAG